MPSFTYTGLAATPPPCAPLHSCSPAPRRQRRPVLPSLPHTPVRAKEDAFRGKIEAGHHGGTEKVLVLMVDGELHPVPMATRRH
jgi:hypothetical protein